MATPEEDPLSYTQLSGLRQIIRQEWHLFAPYLPPRNKWEAKVEEVEQIRHRVAHFRAGHADDLSRVIQLLRDIAQGLWRFCTSYNDPQPVLPPSDDPVVSPLRFTAASALRKAATFLMIANSSSALRAVASKAKSGQP